jgi:DNA-binding beta-propeller fold protein YncE
MRNIPFLALFAGLLALAACLINGCGGGGMVTGGPGGGNGGGGGGGGNNGGGSNGGDSFSFSFGSSGSGNGQLGAPKGIAQDANGNIYVTDGAVQLGGFGNNRIEKFTATGTFVGTITASGALSNLFEAPTSITLDTAGNIYCVVNPGIVLQLSNSGVVNGEIGAQGQGAGQYTNPTSVFFGTGSLLYVTDFATNQIDIYNTSGVFLAAFNAGGQLLQPTAAATDSHGNIFVVDNGHGRIVELSNTGSVIKTFGPNPGQFTNLQGIAVTGSNIYVTDAANNTVYKFDTSGNLLTSFGSAGSGSGQLSGPTGILVAASGKVYVVDTGNDRVEVFSPS